jgi:hypothetical protein
MRYSIIILAVLVLQLTGCAHYYDRRDAPWDPKPGQTLFDQIPNWQGGALRRCGGHMRPEEAARQGRTMRC